MSEEDVSEGIANCQMQLCNHDAFHSPRSLLLWSTQSITNSGVISTTRVVPACLSTWVQPLSPFHAKATKPHLLNIKLFWMRDIRGHCISKDDGCTTVCSCYEHPAFRIDEISFLRLLLLLLLLRLYFRTIFFSSTFASTGLRFT
jgi:hypothetical protein